MPAGLRPDMRQVSYAGRVMRSEAEGIRAIAKGKTELATRLRRTIEDSDGSCGQVRLEGVIHPRGHRFPGEIDIPVFKPGEQDREDRINRAIEVARGYESSNFYATARTTISAYSVCLHIQHTFSNHSMSDSSPLQTHCRKAVEDYFLTTNVGINRNLFFPLFKEDGSSSTVAQVRIVYPFPIQLMPLTEQLAEL